jgi:hypothetical protein
MPGSDLEDNADTLPGTKRFRSVREYREMKRLQKHAGSNSDRSVSPEPESKQAPPKDQKEEFVKLLKDTVAQLCYGRLVNLDDPQDDSEVPEWRRVSRIISQTLLEKESRMPPDVRYKVAPSHAREATIKRVQGYTIAYLDRKYPK